VVPIPTLPFESITKAVEVAAAVEVEMRKRGEVESDRPSMESLPWGVVDAPRPRFPAREKMRAVEVAVPFVDEAIVKSGLV
jgi:hypothetical protein